jgi:hypothetical protein
MPEPWRRGWESNPEPSKIPPSGCTTVSTTRSRDTLRGSGPRADSVPAAKLGTVVGVFLLAPFGAGPYQSKGAFASSHAEASSRGRLHEIGARNRLFRALGAARVPARTDLSFYGARRGSWRFRMLPGSPLGKSSTLGCESRFQLSGGRASLEFGHDQMLDRWPTGEARAIRIDRRWATGRRKRIDLGARVDANVADLHVVAVSGRSSREVARQFAPEMRWNDLRAEAEMGLHEHPHRNQLPLVQLVRERLNKMLPRCVSQPTLSQKPLGMKVMSARVFSLDVLAANGDSADFVVRAGQTLVFRPLFRVGVEPDRVSKRSVAAVARQSAHPHGASRTSGETGAAARCGTGFSVIGLAAPVRS